MKHCLYIFLFALSILFLASCTNDYVDDMKQGNGKRLCHLSLNADVSGYSDNVASRAAMSSIPTSATLYLYFSANGTTIPAVAKYNASEKNWDLSFEGSLSPNGTCKVYYITDAKSTTETEVQLTSSSAVYGTSSGSYTYTDTKGVSVTATLQPVLSRIRFKGAVGTQITVSGAKMADVFKISDASYTTSSSPQFLTVSSDGYTPYLYYAQPNGTNPLSIQSDSEDFTIANPLSSEGGHSAFITIPTIQSHYGWTIALAAVDLGLSVKWANMNVGASNPEDHGGYYAWGETDSKDFYNYSMSNYKWCNGSYNNLTKYCTDSKYGTVDNKTVLDPEDDVAHVKWGGNWRMPTMAEFKELQTECTWYSITQDGVHGYKVTSKMNGNSIFLPAAGYGFDSNLYGYGSNGYYWSSSLGEIYSFNAGSLYFDYTFHLNDDNRYNGFSVRPVCP